jgi:MFS family permease
MKQEDSNMTAPALKIEPHRTPLLALFAGNAVSLVGNVLALIAIPWFVLQTTGSATLTGVTGAVAAAPVVIAGIFGGTFVDRLGFRRASVISDIASGVTVALIPLLHYTVGLAFWQLLVLVFLGALLDAPGATARASLLPDLADLARMRRERVNAIEQAISRFSFFLGPPLAGILIALVGTSNVLWLNAASFVVSAALVAFFVPAPERVDRMDATPNEGYVEGLKAAGGFLRANPLMLAILFQVSITNFLDAALSVVYPVYAEREFGSAVDLGLMLSSFAAGAVATTLVFAAVGHRLPRRETYIGAFVLSSLPIAVLALSPGLPLVMAAMLVRGLGAGPLNPILLTLEQERVPAEMRGRVFGLMMACSWLTLPLGRLLSGAAIDGIGMGMTLVLVGAAYLLTTLSMLLWPVMREMNQEYRPPDARALRSDAPSVT